MTTIKSLYHKHRNIISYVFFGALTTGVNFVSYTFYHYVLHLNKNLANVFAILTAILFAYITNKLFVFRSKTANAKELFTEMFKFFSARGVSLIIEAGGFWLLATCLGVNDYLAKISLAVVILLLNYIFSKLVVFKNGADKRTGE